MDRWTDQVLPERMVGGEGESRGGNVCLPEQFGNALAPELAPFLDPSCSTK